MGDDALTAHSVYDVFHGHPPLQGAMSATENASGVLVHHPGPLQYYLLAPVTFVLGGAGWTLAVASGALSAVLVIIAIAAGYALAERWGGIGALAATATVGVVGGLDTYIRPFNPLPRSLAVVAMFILVVLLLRRRMGALPWFVFTASLITQTHLSGLPFMAVVLVPLVVIGLVRWWQIRGTIWPMRGWVPRSYRPRRGLVWGSWAVLLACWIPPVLELFVRTPNNLTQVWRFTTSSSRASGTSNDIRDVLLGHLASVYPFSTEVGRFASQLGGFRTADYSVMDVLLGGICLVMVIGVAVAPKRLMSARGMEPAWLPVAARVSLWFQLALVSLIYMVPATNHQVWNYTLVPGVVAMTWWVTVSAMVYLLLSAAQRVGDGRALAYARRRPGPLSTPRGALPRPAVQAVVVVGTLCLGAAPLADREPDSLHAGDGFADAARVVAAELSTLGAPPRHVNMVGVGFVSIFDIAPAIGYELRREGIAVHLPSFFTEVEDTEFRKGITAPHSSVQLVLYGPGHRAEPGERYLAQVQTPQGAVRIYHRPSSETR